jgi:hypothetical protein
MIVFYRVVFGIFFTHFVFCAHKQLSWDTQLSLKTLIERFEDLKKGCDKTNIERVKSLSWYQDACKVALTSDNTWIWYRVALARVMYSLGSVGFDVVKEKIEPWLHHWGLLKRITGVDPCQLPYQDTIKDSSQEWDFINWHYKLCGIFNMRSSNEVQEVLQSPEWFWRFDETSTTVKKVLSYDPQMFYCSEKNRDGFNLLLKRYDGREAKTLLNNPKSGLLFAGGPYYGILDYLNKSALIYHVSYLEAVKFVDFGKDIPWDQIKRYNDSISVCIKGMYLILMLNILGIRAKKYLYFKMIFDSIVS